MHWLITGGAGFIGSHLSELLLSQGDQVTVIDDFSTGRLENIAAVLTHDRFQLVRASVEDEGVMNLLASQCDGIFHLASAVGVQLILDEPVKTINTTIHGTEVVLQAAHRFGRPTLMTSSSEVYGKGSRVPFCEDDDVVMGPTRHNRWCYAYSKAIDEFLGLAYYRQYGLPVVIVRLFNTVGPRQVGQYGMVLPRFVSAALQGEPLHVYGDGQQTRCFCHVSDVVDAMVRLMKCKEACGNVFNLGSDHEVSINELARMVVEIARSPSRIEHISYQQAYGQPFDDMARRVPSLCRVRESIGFQPRLPLEKIIESVIQSQRNHG